MSPKRRGVLRVGASAQARLAVVDQTVRVSKKRVWYPISIFDASPEGIGLELDRKAQLIPGSVVTVHIKLGAVEAQLKGRLVWSDKKDDTRDRAGVALRLEILDQRTRTAYFNWVAKHAASQGLMEDLQASVGKRT